MSARGRSALVLAVVAFALLAASAPPGPTVQCDHGNASACSEDVQLALALADQQGQPVASVQVVAPLPTRFDTNGVHYLDPSSGQTLALVILRDAAATVTSIVEIGTIGVSQVPTAFAADPATHPAWFATYGYPTSYLGPRATVPPAELSIQTIMMFALVALAAAVLVRVGVTTLRSPRATI